MVCLGRNGVEVMNDVRSGNSLEPAGGKTNVVDAPVGGLPVFFGDACESVSITCV